MFDRYRDLFQSHVRLRIPFRCSITNGFRSTRMIIVWDEGVALTHQTCWDACTLVHDSGGFGHRCPACVHDLLHALTFIFFLRGHAQVIRR